jgi:hypothetical protein
MKRLVLVSFLAASLGNSTYLYAQDSLVGTYTGGFTPSGELASARQVGVALVIASEEGGVVKGTAKLTSSWSTSGCSGEYPMAGKYQGGKLVMRNTAKGGSSGDCDFSFNVTREGNKLVGATGTTGKGSPLQLSK